MLNKILNPMPHRQRMPKWPVLHRSTVDDFSAAGQAADLRYRIVEQKRCWCHWRQSGGGGLDLARWAGSWPWPSAWLMMASSFLNARGMSGRGGLVLVIQHSASIVGHMRLAHRQKRVFERQHALRRCPCELCSRAKSSQRIQYGSVRWIK